MAILQGADLPGVFFINGKIDFSFRSDPQTSNLHPDLFVRQGFLLACGQVESVQFQGDLGGTAVLRPLLEFKIGPVSDDP